MNEQQKKRSDAIKAIILGVIILIMVALTIYFLPQIKLLFSDEGRESVKTFIHSLGAWGVLAFLGLQVLQIVVAFIPGEPIEIIAGVLYGTWGGMAVCLAGIVIGTTLVYSLVRALGQPFANKLLTPERTKKFKILQNEKRLELLVFILFFIPGTPKDVFTYLVPLTAIKPIRYFLLATLGRIPSIASSALVGESLGNGQWVFSLVVFALTAIIGLAGILINDRFMKYLEKKKLEKHEQN